jgi:CBS domain containing-hemolysin-like protein
VVTVTGLISCGKHIAVVIDVNSCFVPGVFAGEVSIEDIVQQILKSQQAGVFPGVS